MKNMTLIVSMATPTFAAAYANTNAGATFWIASDAQEVDLTLAQFEALTWVQVKKVGSHGETGVDTNILTYDTWDSDVVQKGKGMSNAGDPDVELSRVISDAGQIALRAAAKTNSNYAFKIVHNDAPVAGTPTIIYNRGLVTGPKRTNGRNEDFILETFKLGLQQLEIVDDAA